jgi:hypothetical protein
MNCIGPRKLAYLLVAFFASLIGPNGLGNPGDPPTTGGPSAQPDWILHAQPNPSASVAYQWVDILEEAAARRIDKVGAKPPIISREMGIVLEAVYDAWSAYDDKAVGTRLGDTLRRPVAEQTQKNKETAIGYAALRTLEFVYWDDVPWIEEQAKKIGVDPDEKTTDLSKPAGVGNVAARAVIDYRMRDGANQSGDEPCSNGKPYSD